MLMRVNGVVVPIQQGITIEITTNPGGEVCPPILLEVNGGFLDVYRSTLTSVGPVRFHWMGPPLPPEPG